MLKDPFYNYRLQTYLTFSLPGSNILPQGVFRCFHMCGGAFLSFFLSLGYLAFCQAVIVNNNKLRVWFNKDYMDLLYHLVVQIGIA